MVRCALLRGSADERRIPFERSVDLANQFGVSHLLAPLFDYTAPPPPVSLANGAAPPTQFNADNRSNGAETSESGRKRAGNHTQGASSDEPKRARLDGVNGLGAGSHGDSSFQLKRSTKAEVPAPEGPHLAIEDPLRLERHKTILKSIFAQDPATNAGVPDLAATFSPDINPDTPIDDHDHTALHWAAALARISVVRALIDFGADMHRGNNVGETPLIRAVLVTNNSDNAAFMHLLEVLGPSLRTVDDTGRSILHHAALVAAVKGRASSARYYMESVLEYVARNEKGQFKDLVDAQDVHGDTALNIAARVGNRGLVRMLIEVGADKAKPNKLGLRPGDFGIEGVVRDLHPSSLADRPQDLTVPPIDDIISSIAPAPSAPAQKSSEVLANLTAMITSLNSDFEDEVKVKTDALDRTRSQLRAATRELSEQRKQMTLWRAKVSQVNEKTQRIKNLERALLEEDSFDWTGRTEIDGTPATEGAGPGFTYRGPSSTLSNLPAGIAIEFAADPPPPEDDAEPNSLVHLLRLELWYDRVLTLLTRRIEKLQGGNHEQEARLQKIVAGCCGVEQDKVSEAWLTDILAAVESDGSALDMTRVATFLGRVRDGSWL